MKELAEGTSRTAWLTPLPERGKRLAGVQAADSVLDQIVSTTTQLSLDGHRADIVILKAARALAAFKGNGAIGADEIREAAMLSGPPRQTLALYGDRRRKGEDRAGALRTEDRMNFCGFVGHDDQAGPYP